MSKTREELQRLGMRRVIRMVVRRVEAAGFVTDTIKGEWGTLGSGVSAYLDVHEPRDEDWHWRFQVGDFLGTIRISDHREHPDGGYKGWSPTCGDERHPVSNLSIDPTTGLWMADVDLLLKTWVAEVAESKKAEAEALIGETTCPE